MKKPLPDLTVTITALSHDGRGIANVNGKTLFVQGALPDETALCTITKTHSRFNEAIAKEIMQRSPNRVDAPCPHFNICGGCSLQHLADDAQIHFKQQALVEQLKHFGHVSADTLLPPITGNTLHYRRKARIGVRFVRKKQRVLVGFREKNSAYLADLQTCPILHETVGTRIEALSHLIASLSQYEHIAQIEIAVGDKATALVFRHLTELPDEDKTKLSQFGNTHGLHIYLQPNAPLPVTKLFPDDHNELLSYDLPDYQLTMQFHPLDFCQINSEINLKMIPQALSLLDIQPDDHVLDLFCGLGNFTLPIARQAKHVTGVEGSEEMVTRAKSNAQYNNIVNADFYAANLADAKINPPWAQQKYQKVLLDPPRTGAKEILPLIAASCAKRIVYVSCNPATLARDAGILVHSYGYHLKTVGVINMFPHTSHIEAMALFEL